MKLNKLIDPLIKNIFFSTILFLVLFIVFRFLLFISNYEIFSDIPFSELIIAYIIGMRFDLSITLYCLSLFSLINFIFFFFNASPKLFKFNIAYLTFFFGLITFIGFVEIEFFRYFKVRLNSYSLTAAESPEFVFKMILEMYPVPIYVFFILLITSSGFIFIYLIQNKFTLKSKSNSKIGRAHV